jgi:hypothetical protein
MLSTSFLMNIPILYFGSLGSVLSPCSLSGSKSDLSLWSSGFLLSASNASPPVVDEAIGNDTVVPRGCAADGWAPEDSEVALAVAKAGTFDWSGIIVLYEKFVGLWVGAVADAPGLADLEDTLAASAEPGVLALLGGIGTDVGGVGSL